ncbi:MAG: rod shape-determining protein [Oliverpabstia sp.]|nr:rod shape-determining protein [Oliverpabstia sp.]
MFTNHVYGIDLGSNMIKIYSQKSDEILKERNMIAIRNKEQILAVGDEAYEMYEKSPANVEVSSPMSNGMIANISHLEILLQTLLERTSRSTGRHPVIYFAVPVDMTEIEKRAYYSVAQRGRFRKSKVLLVERPVADALALGIPIIKTRGSMIVNIGAATTEISVIADSRVIISKIVPLGGDHFNQDILNNIRRRNNFFVSLRTAGRLKASLADLKQERKLARKIVGVDCVSGLPRERIVTSATINESILSSVNKIAEEIRTFLERTPPQIHKVILAEGIYLTGGSTRIPYIAQVISRQVGCPILLSQYYDLCTIYGLKEIITHDALHHWAFTPKKRKK